MILYFIAASVAGLVSMFASSNEGMFMVGFMIFIFGGVCTDFLNKKHQRKKPQELP